MTSSELEKVKNALTLRQSELEKLIRNREAVAIETSADALDQIQHAVDRELTLGTLALESACLRDTRAALLRIDRGTFGVCLDSEDDIGAKRLAAVPWTARCIVCQDRYDRQGAKDQSTFEPELVLAWYPKLAEATPDQLRHWKRSGAAYGIRWPDLDKDLSAEGLPRGAPAVRESSGIATR